MLTVLIAIQARSSSQRLPNKSLSMMAGKPALQWVIEPCQYVSICMARDAQKADAQIKSCLVVPKGDPIVNVFSGMIPVVEGDESDVLGRYVKAMELFKADYIVRVTGDCVQMQSHIIARHVKAALFKGKDYTTNTHFRTYREGYDCEVVSRRLLVWLDQNAKGIDREHVTTLIARGKKFPFQGSDGRDEICHILNPIDDSEFVCPACGIVPHKTSVDTPLEFEQQEKQILKVQSIKKQARRSGIFYL